ncbi:MAG: SDR family oxidoreductase [Burkholderiales bacterium]|nr:SDR family oxidoreductase [Burkholderiales bacterium]
MNATRQDFTDKNVLVTGATSGIGLASARAFLARGARRVYITGRNPEKLDQALQALGERATGCLSDVARISDLKVLKGVIEQRGDRLDVIFANAGIAEYGSFGAVAEADFDATFDINVKGVFFTVQTLLPLLNPGASIVLNASIVANKGMANLSVYSASKAAVRSFARSWANDLKARQIRVNAISPGVTLTPIMQHGLGMDQSQIDAFSAYLKDAAPAGRMAGPEEIAAAVLFLASESASYVNGIELTVDGGLTQI